MWLVFGYFETKATNAFILLSAVVRRNNAIRISFLRLSNRHRSEILTSSQSAVPINENETSLFTVVISFIVVRSDFFFFLSRWTSRLNYVIFLSIEAPSVEGIDIYLLWFSVNQSIIDGKYLLRSSTEMTTTTTIVNVHNEMRMSKRFWGGISELWPFAYP